MKPLLYTMSLLLQAKEEQEGFETGAGVVATPVVVVVVTTAVVQLQWQQHLLAQLF